jgi:hypothetical protein
MTATHLSLFAGNLASQRIHKKVLCESASYTPLLALFVCQSRSCHISNYTKMPMFLLFWIEKRCAP